jgi:hypothetical protein
MFTKVKFPLDRHARNSANTSVDGQAGQPEALPSPANAPALARAFRETRFFDIST